MTDEIIKEYLKELEPLSTNNFEKELLKASLNNLLEKDNKLRFNNFSCGIRELSRHILLSLSPTEEIESCCWYANDSKKIGQTTRREKIKYAIQKGLPDDFVKKFHDKDSDTKTILDAIDTLNKYTHVNEDTFDIDEDDIDELTVTVLDAFQELLNSIETFYESLKSQLIDNIDDALIQLSIQEAVDEIDILSTHHNIEEIQSDTITINTITSTQILIDITGFINVRHQFGSDGDFARGDGAEMYSDFPFETKLVITINKDFEKSKYETSGLDVDTESWYE